MKLSAKEFKKIKNKRLTLLGMSGVGKTHIAKLLSKQNNWFHYSGDYRIGAKYLNDAILANIKNKMTDNAWLKALLDSDSIVTKNCITFDNLTPVSSFVGKIGNPGEGGLPIDEFIYRQALHRNAEISTMLDVAKFISKAQAQGMDNFVNDAGGSICELDNDCVFKTLAKHTLIIYIKASKSSELTLIKRAQDHPKPLYYQPDFLQQQLGGYLQENKFSYIAQINPDCFVSWIFPKLLAYRRKKYESIANAYGYTIDCEFFYQCKHGSEVLELIYGALD